MPYGDGTGSRGQGGRGRMGGRGLGPSGYCVCHQTGTPCYAMSCPKCGTKMVRE